MIKTDIIVPIHLKHKYDAHKIIFLIIKKLNFLAKCNYHSKVDSVFFEAEKKNLIEKYDELSSKIAGYSLEKFFEEFQLQDDIYAKEIIKNRDKVSQKPPLLASFKCRDLLDLFVFYKPDPRVSNFKAEYYNLKNLIGEFSSEFADKLSSEIALFKKDLNIIDNKTMSDRLSNDEYEQLCFNMDQLHQAINRNLVN